MSTACRGAYPTAIAVRMQSRARAEHAHRTLDPAHARLLFLRFFDRLDVLALMAVAQIAPSLPRARRGLERAHEIRGRLHFALLGIEIEPHLDRLAAFEPCRFA